MYYVRYNDMKELGVTGDKLWCTQK